MIGKQIEQYLVQKQLGHGAMGSIYLALDTLLDRPVALKFILSDFNDHPDAARRFLAEAKVLASLNRPNIPILYGFFIWEGKGVMAMEYVDGETFEAIVRRRGPIPAPESVPLIKQALQGLAFAHRIGIVHRDLKPSNLMLNHEGTVKVVDFGIAKKLQAEAGMTGTNVTLGTPLYMSPEQVLGRPLDARTDIYSMGIVLYELLAGQVPFKADSIYEIQAAHVQKIPEPPTIHCPDIPKEVVSAVMKALQKDPADRFASAEDFIRALPDLAPMQAPQPLAAPVAVPVKLKPPPEPVPSPPTPDSRESQANHAATQVATFEKTIVEAVQRPSFAEHHAARHTEHHAAQISGQHAEQQKTPGGQANKKLVAGLAVGLFLLLAAGATWFALSSRRSSKSNAGLTASNASATNGNAGTASTAAPVSKPQDNRPPQPQPMSEPAAPPVPESKNLKQTPVPAVANPVKPRVVAPTPPPPQTPARAAGEELTGIWRGTYSDTASQEKTEVQLNIQELNGKDVVGSLSFQKADHTSGQCDLSKSTYTAEARKLKLLFHCNGPAPAYFKTPTTFSGIDPDGNNLSAGTVYSFKNFTVDIQRQ